MTKNLRNSFFQHVGLNIIGMIGMSAYILADTFFVSSALGSVGLAALNFSIPVFSVLQGLGLMLGIGGATRFSIYHHEGNEKRGSTVFTQTVMMGGGVALVFLVLGLFFAAPLATLLGADELVLPMAKTYLTTVMSFAPAFLLNNILLAFVRNDGNPRLSMIAMVVSSLSNIVLDYVFMFPLSMGMFGAAFATGLSPAISLGILSLHFRRKNQRIHLKKCRLPMKTAFKITSLGMSSFVGELASAVAMITFNLVILRIEGNIGVAAYGIIANIALVATAALTGIAQGLQPLASQCYGTRDHAALSAVARYSLVTAGVLSVLIYGGAFAGCGLIVAIFNSEQNQMLAQIAEGGMKIYFLSYLFAGINLVSAAFLSATSNPRGAMVISLLRSCILLIPATLILSSFFGMTGVWSALVLTEFGTLLVTIYFWRQRRKENI